jgi:hypothetical protein
MGEETARQRVVNVDMLEIYFYIENMVLWVRSEIDSSVLEFCG